MKSRAFTLIELLVVISIIAILASILFPVFAQAREKAKAAQCQSNHKQAAAAILMYCNDNDDYLPLADKYGFLPGNSGWGNYNGAMGSDMPWTWTIQAYVRDTNILACPCDPEDEHFLDPRSMQAASSVRWRNKIPNCFHSNFGFNYQYLSNATGKTPQTLIWNVAQASNVGSPSNTVLLVDSEFWRDTGGSPIGGGSFVVDAPFDPPGILMNKATLNTPNGDYTPHNWQCFLTANGDQSKPACSTDGSAWGKAYPFHPMGQGFTVCYIDSHVKSVSAGGLIAGWDYRNDKSGENTDWDKFPWDTY